MIEVTRRGVIGGAVAASAVGAIIPAQTRAAGPVASKQAVGFYHYNVGDIQVTVVTDGARSFPLPDGFIANAKKEEINAALQTNKAASAYDARGLLNSTARRLVN